MKKYFVLFAFFFILTACKGKEETNRVMLPDPQIIGKNINNSLALFDKKSNSKEKYPIQVVVDAERGHIKGIIAVYSKTFSFADVALSIDELYGNWRISKTDNPPMELWRVTPKKIGIQLSINDNGLVQVIILPFRRQ